MRRFSALLRHAKFINQPFGSNTNHWPFSDSPPNDGSLGIGSSVVAVPVALESRPGSDTIG